MCALIIAELLQLHSRAWPRHSVLHSSSCGPSWTPDGLITVRSRPPTATSRHLARACTTGQGPWPGLLGVIQGLPYQEQVYQRAKNRAAAARVGQGCCWQSQRRAEEIWELQESRGEDRKWCDVKQNRAKLLQPGLP